VFRRRRSVAFRCLRRRGREARSRPDGGNDRFADDLEIRPERPRGINERRGPRLGVHLAEAGFRGLLAGGTATYTLSGLEKGRYKVVTVVRDAGSDKSAKCGNWFSIIWIRRPAPRAD
jgi:hypothetical protein